MFHYYKEPIFAAMLAEVESQNANFQRALREDKQAASELRACLTAITHGFDPHVISALCLKGAHFSQSYLFSLIHSLLGDIEDQKDPARNHEALVVAYLLCEYLLLFSSALDNTPFSIFNDMRDRLYQASREIAGEQKQTTQPTRQSSEQILMQKQEHLTSDQAEGQGCAGRDRQDVPATGFEEVAAALEKGVKSLKMIFAGEDSPENMMRMREAFQSLRQLRTKVNLPSMGNSYTFSPELRSIMRAAMDHHFNQHMESMQPSAQDHYIMGRPPQRSQPTRNTVSPTSNSQNTPVTPHTGVPAPILKRTRKLVEKIKKYQVYLTPDDHMGILRSNSAFRDFFYPRLKDNDIGSVQDFSDSVEILARAASPEKILYALELIHAEVKEMAAAAQVEKHVRES